jgi:large conductance mechanosensitive channel
MSMLKEFKEFAMRGNVIDLAVGIVIGAAFTKIVNSLVAGVFTPITAYLTGNTDLSDMTFPLKPVVGGQKAAAIGWGSVVQATVEFIIVAFALFLVVKVMNKLKRRESPPPKAPTEEILLLREIRDALAKNRP